MKQTNEVREAAERIIAGTEEVDHLWATATTVAHAYLAEHRPDDDEPVTEEWLRNSKFYDRYLTGNAWASGPVAVELDHESPWMTIVRDHPSHVCLLIKTSEVARGDVRKLADVLGVELKEQQ